MKRTLILTAIMLFAFAGTHAQTVDEVLNKYFEATGQNKIADVQSFYVKANMSMMGMEMPMVIQMKRPDEFRTEMEVMGQKIVQGFDGD